LSFLSYKPSAIVRNGWTIRRARRAVRYAYLDGKTRDRKSPVERSRTIRPPKLFLISLKAGV